MNMVQLLAESFRYPAPGRLETLEKGLAQLPAGSAAHKSLAAFVGCLQGLSLHEWEELYTRTWDINPVAAPYVGYQAWGESYQRGNFLALMSRTLREAGVESDGELPDHLVPVLRYLGAGGAPLVELHAILPAALERMSATLRKADPKNPYHPLLEAVSQAVQQEPAPAR
jgi:nitrate reductase molybdenum cofactor assembly chaperone NarJ/NarW